MKKHTKIYMDFFNFKIVEDCICEICSKQAVDIHHIVSRGMGGSKTKDYIENLMAVCRGCHIKYGDVKNEIEFLKKIHANFIDKNKYYKYNVGKPFDIEVS